MTGCECEHTYIAFWEKAEDGEKVVEELSGGGGGGGEARKNQLPISDFDGKK